MKQEKLCAHFPSSRSQDFIMIKVYIVLLLCITSHRQREEFEEDMPYMKSNGATETEK